jgi:deoxyhypusine synthase
MMKFETAAEVIAKAARAAGYRVTNIGRSEITARLGRSRRVLRILCNPESASPISPVGAVGLDAELLRERLVDALVSAGLLS